MSTRVEKIERADGVTQGYHVNGDTVPLNRTVAPDTDVRSIINLQTVADRVNRALGAIDNRELEPTVSGAEPASPELVNGWERRGGAWATDGSSYGDLSVGEAYEDSYRQDNGDGTWDVTTYGYYVEPVQSSDGDIRFTAQERVENITCTDPDDPGSTEITSDYTYGYAQPFYYHTVEEAQEACKRIALGDKRSMFPPPEATSNARP